MEKRTCQKCGENNYSSDSRNVWECCKCKEMMIKKIEEKENIEVTK